MLEHRKWRQVSTNMKFCLVCEPEARARPARHQAPPRPGTAIPPSGQVTARPQPGIRRYHARTRDAP